jgi:hypothetical protein
MSEEELLVEAKELSQWQQHKFMVLVAATIAVSLLLVVVALWLYNTSGAAQLDLSRPGYQSVRDKVEHSNDFDGFSFSGTIDEEALSEFRDLYDKQLKEATTVESFGGDVMDDDSLGIDAPGQSR